eukprot:CAMPEP_0185251806 /NCGR_PEP_ID=MMETSP1359-20130426/1124_1 /TAXON_ID=552665 /ORGANISM="Bigelowiella longifila, Strain CCMP242" /LENGTH=146 /DNA_ID=CAMNT_0027833835 /DNA_START=31 /DNA_END=471 /DNA_ORIENTATION=+
MIALAFLLLLPSSQALQNLPGGELIDLIVDARKNETEPEILAVKCVDDAKLLASLSGHKKMTCEMALKMYQDQDASCDDDLGFGPLSKPCPVTCGICEPSEERRAVVIALQMIRAALAELTPDEQSQVMAGLWQDAEEKGMTPKLE